MSVLRNDAYSARPMTAYFLKPVMVIGLGILVALLVTSGSGYLIGVVLAAVILGFMLGRNLQLGVFLYFCIAALALGETPGIQSPHSGYSAGLMPSQLLLAFMIFLWMFKAVFVDRLTLVDSMLNKPLFALMGVSLASLIANNMLAGTRELLFHELPITQMAEVGLLGFSVCAYFLVANTLKDSRWIRRIFLPVTILGLYFAAHRIFHFDLPIPMIWGSLLLAAAIAFVYSRLLFDRLDRSTTYGFGFLFAVMIYAAFSNLSWISGWIASMGAVMVVSFYRSKALALVLVVLTLLALFVYPGVYQSIHEESATGGDFDRFVIWVDAFKMFVGVNPLLGIGPGNYHPYAYYYSTIWYGGSTYTTAHSNYAQMAAELGLVGLAVFLWVIITAVRTGSRAARTAPQELRWLGVSATAVVAAIAVASLFGDYLFPSRGNNGLVNFGTTVYTWLILGAAVAAGNIGNAKPQKQEQETPGDQ